MRKITLATLLPALCACTTTAQVADAAPTGASDAGRTCDASGLQDHIGHTASQASGTTLLELSGAQTLRWGPPNAAWTRDYRVNRVNVRYDAAMKIIEITCG